MRDDQDRHDSDDSGNESGGPSGTGSQAVSPASEDRAAENHGGIRPAEHAGESEGGGREPEEELASITKKETSEKDKNHR